MSATTTSVPFTKVQGTGNDFVLIDGRERDLDWSALARSICDRHFGVGADGLLVAQESARAPIRMAMYNPDGSPAEMCGNGLRCFVKFAIERGGVAADTDALNVETGAGVLQATFDQPDGVIGRVRVSLGAPSFEPDQIPIKAPGPGPVIDFPLDINDECYPITAVSMGNPHAVHLTETSVDTFDLRAIGPPAEHHAAFPQRTNFEIANVIARDRLRMRVWERGAGITLACGTGAAAVMVAARVHGLVDPGATVSLPGGDLQLQWDGPRADGAQPPVYLQGPAEYVFDGEWNLNGHA